MCVCVRVCAFSADGRLSVSSGNLTEVQVAGIEPALGTAQSILSSSLNNTSLLTAHHHWATLTDVCVYVCMYVCMCVRVQAPGLTVV